VPQTLNQLRRLRANRAPVHAPAQAVSGVLLRSHGHSQCRLVIAKISRNQARSGQNTEIERRRLNSDPALWLRIIELHGQRFGPGDH
jgi:hypothetical protein